MGLKHIVNKFSWFFEVVIIENLQYNAFNNNNNNSLKINDNSNNNAIICCLFFFTQAHADQLASAVSVEVYRLAGGVGDPPS